MELARTIGNKICVVSTYRSNQSVFNKLYSGVVPVVSLLACWKLLNVIRCIVRLGLGLVTLTPDPFHSLKRPLKSPNM